MASAVVEDKKYDEGVYRHKEVINSDIPINIGNKLYLQDKLYGIIVKESESFYYIQKENVSEPYEFQKTSVQDKLSNRVFRLVD